MTTLLAIKNITVHYGMAEAVRGVSLDIAEGEIITLIGANGAGKSTIMKTISGTKKPITGEIWFRGERIDKLSPEKIVARGIAHVPERRRVFPYMSVSDNLKAGAYLRKDSEIGPDLENVFHHFSVLKQRLGQMAGTLSGGEQQMLAMARGLMAGPSLMLLDEPSLGLAPIMVMEVANIATEINKQGVGIILVEQNVGLAFRLAQRAYVLETGSIVLEGDTAELLNDQRVKEGYLGI
ncbi:MAG: ABC transporter ATP-binding protein [Deltaproteobacteria bacterium]|nr:ABC transporter ATP-binding protein [Deltaproteobacteria bacterium]